MRLTLIFQQFHFNSMLLEAHRRWFELPSGFPGSNPWDEPYRLKDPTYVTKGVKWLRSLLEAKKEKEAIEAAKKAAKNKFNIGESRDKGKKEY